MKKRDDSLSVPLSLCGEYYRASCCVSMRAGGAGLVLVLKA